MLFRSVLQVTYSTIGCTDQHKSRYEIRDRTNVTTKDIFDLFLLEATFDNQTARSIYRPSRTHLGEHKLNDVLWLSVHSFADIWDIGEDRFLVSFSHDLWGSNGVAFGAGREKGGI